MVKPVYEFLLWDNCHNNCQFCFLRQRDSDLNIEQKRKSVDKVLQFLESDQFVQGSHVLLMGGEIFDDRSSFSILNNLIDVVVTKMLNYEIDWLYLNTNLIYKDMTGLYYLLDKIDQHQLFDRLRFTTSYDIVGRFATKKVEQLMLYNIDNLVKKYPNIQIIANAIMTKQLCDMIVTHKFSVKQFMERYKCGLSLIPYIVLDDKLTADRKEILRTLSVVDNEIPGYVKNGIKNFDNDQKKLLYKYDKATDSLKFCSCDYSDCGHPVNFKRYATSGTCYACDVKALFDLE